MKHCTKLANWVGNRRYTKPANIA